MFYNMIQRLLNFVWSLKIFFHISIHGDTCSSWNENLNLLVWIKFLNLFLYTVFLYKNWKIYRFDHSFTGLGPEYRCLLWGLYMYLSTRWAIQYLRSLLSWFNTWNYYKMFDFFFQEIWGKRKVNLWCTLWYYKQHCLYNIS